MGRSRPPRLRAPLPDGEDTYRDKTGLLVKAYRSELDDTLQPYALYEPGS